MEIGIPFLYVNDATTATSHEVLVVAVVSEAPLVLPCLYLYKSLQDFLNTNNSLAGGFIDLIEQFNKYLTLLHHGVNTYFK